jgi:hypothetical protein
VSACLDAGTNPLNEVVAPDNPASAFLSGDLATVPRLISDHGLDLEGVVEVEAWWDSWKLDEAEGVQLRTQIYPSAAQRLFPVMGLAGLQDAMDQNALGLEAAGVVGAIVDSETMSDALDRARGFYSEGRSALERGEGEESLMLVLRTADAIWEVSPERVATELIERATDAMGRKSEADSYSKEELIRIRRLLYGASEALEAGDYPGAIRRACYACQLLGANSP